MLFLRSVSLSKTNPYRRALTVFVVFFIGWFTIHSSTQYYFSYYVIPTLALTQAVFFSYGALVYKKAGEWRPGQKLSVE